MKKSSKYSVYTCLISIIPLIISLIMTPWFSFEVSLLVYVVSPVYLILMYIAIKYARKDTVYHSFKLGKLTARTIYIIAGVVPIGVLILGPVYDILYVGIDIMVIALWGAICILAFIAAFIYKTPEKPE